MVMCSTFIWLVVVAQVTVHDYNENYGFRKQFLKINSLDVMFAF